MSQLTLIIARIDNLDSPDMLTEVWRQTMPVVDPTSITPEHYLDGPENTVTEIGWAAMRRLMAEQWRLTDQVLVSRFRREQTDATVGDGYDPLKVASRLGVVHLPRQVCYLPGEDHHTLPGNAGLPAHEGQVTTRGLQEWACLLPQDLPFGTAERLLGWMTHDPAAMSETGMRRWVCAWANHPPGRASGSGSPVAATQPGRAEGAVARRWRTASSGSLGGGTEPGRGNGPGTSGSTTAGRGHGERLGTDRGGPARRSLCQCRTLASSEARGSTLRSGRQYGRSRSPSPGETPFPDIGHRLCAHRRRLPLPEWKHRDGVAAIVLLARAV